MKAPLEIKCLSVCPSPKPPKALKINYSTLSPPSTPPLPSSRFPSFSFANSNLFVQYLCSNKFISRESIERGKETRVKCSVKFENYPPLGV